MSEQDETGLYRRDVLRRAGGVPFVFAPGVVPAVEAQSATGISNVQELQDIQNDLSGDYVLTDDIDASGFDFDPIGDLGNPFKGSLDGNGHVISGLTVNQPDNDDVGLFAAVDRGSVTKVGLNNVDITGNVRVGALAGVVIGGDASRCYATGSVQGNEDVGGLCGQLEGAETKKSYTNVNVNGDRIVGGVVGRVAPGDLTETYAAGSVTGTDFVGGLVGGNTGTVKDSYWDTDKTGQTDGLGGNQGSTSNIEGLSTGEMTGSGALGNMSGFASSTWTEVSGDYPALSWENTGGGGGSADALDDLIDEKRRLFNRIDNISFTNIEKQTSVEQAITAVEDAVDAGNITVNQGEEEIERLILGEEVANSALTAVGTASPRSSMRPEIDLAAEIQEKAIMMVVSAVIQKVLNKYVTGILNDLVSKVPIPGLNPKAIVRGIENTLNLILTTIRGEPTALEGLIQGIATDTLGDIEDGLFGDGQGVTDAIRDKLGNSGYAKMIQLNIENPPAGVVGGVAVPGGSKSGGMDDSLRDLNQSVKDVNNSSFDLSLSQAKQEVSTTKDEIYSMASDASDALDKFNPIENIKSILDNIITIIKQFGDGTDTQGAEGQKLSPQIAFTSLVAIAIALGKILSIISTIMTAISIIESVLSIIRGGSEVALIKQSHNDVVQSLAKGGN